MWTDSIQFCHWRIGNNCHAHVVLKSILDECMYYVKSACYKVKYHLLQLVLFTLARFNTNMTSSQSPGYYSVSNIVWWSSTSKVRDDILTDVSTGTNTQLHTIQPIAKFKMAPLINCISSFTEPQAYISSHEQTSCSCLGDYPSRPPLATLQRDEQ